MFIPPETSNPKSESPVSFFERILISAPPTSPFMREPNTLFTPTAWIMSDAKKSSEMFLYSGSSEGMGKPFREVALNRSPNPRTNTFFTPSCFDMPDIFTTAPSASLAPFREISCAPIACTATTEFFCSTNNIDSDCRFTLATTSTPPISMVDSPSSKLNSGFFPASIFTFGRIFVSYEINEQRSLYVPGGMCSMM